MTRTELCVCFLKLFDHFMWSVLAIVNYAVKHQPDICAVHTDIIVRRVNNPYASNLKSRLKHNHNKLFHMLLKYSCSAINSEVVMPLRIIYILSLKQVLYNRIFSKHKRPFVEQDNSLYFQFATLHEVFTKKKFVILRYLEYPEL